MAPVAAPLSLNSLSARDRERLRSGMRAPAVATIPAGARATSLSRRVLRALLRAVDEAPFDLAWPPSPQTLARRAGSFSR